MLSHYCCLSLSMSISRIVDVSHCCCLSLMLSLTQYVCFSLLPFCTAAVCSHCYCHCLSVRLPLSVSVVVCRHKMHPVTIQIEAAALTGAKCGSASLSRCLPYSHSLAVLSLTVEYRIQLRCDHSCLHSHSHSHRHFTFDLLV